MGDTPPETRDRRVIRAWCLYDWASSAFATSVMVALLPPFYRSLALRAGFSAGAATALWGYTTALALVAVALVAPLLGAISDATGHCKRYLALFVGQGLLATAALALLGRDTWWLASLVFIVADFGFAAANVFYESLLPRIAPRQAIHQISTRGYALGYAGGGLLLAIHALVVMEPQRFGMPDTTTAVRAAFVSVALWWGIFAVPLLRQVPESVPAATSPAQISSLRAGVKRLAATLREARRYRQLFTFLIAFWLYNDGIGTIIKMATAFGDEIGISLTDMILALIVTQAIGIPATLLCGALAKRNGARRLILAGLGVYAGICVWGYFLRTAVHFYMLAALVGMVQGGCQALSRSLFATLVPRAKAAEFFGFFSTSARLAGMVGPLLFALISQFSGGSRLSVLALVAFFLAGGLLLARVDLQEGERAAQSI